MLHDLLNATSFSIYMGRAVLVLALIGPLAYCTADETRSKAASDVAAQRITADLQEACIAQRGTWDSWNETCEFND